VPLARRGGAGGGGAAHRSLALERRGEDTHRRGLEAISRLSKEGIKTNTTLVFSTNQALLAAQAGATYVSPFVGRLDDVGHEGMDMVADVVNVFDRYHFPTQVIAASLRHPRHVIEAARAGAHIATMPYTVLRGMLRHPLTDVGIERFLVDAQKAMKTERV